MTDAERRTSARFRAEYKISYIHENDYLVSFTKDISVDGMFIYTKNAPKVGSLIELTFSIGDLKDVQIKAKVAWVNRLQTFDDPGIGVQFIDPPEDLQNAILRIAKRVAVLEQD